MESAPSHNTESSPCWVFFIKNRSSSRLTCSTVSLLDAYHNSAFPLDRCCTAQDTYEWMFVKAWHERKILPHRKPTASFQKHNSSVLLSDLWLTAPWIHTLTDCHLRVDYQRDNKTTIWLVLSFLVPGETTFEWNRANWWDTFGGEYKGVCSMSLCSSFAPARNIT
jgi:hypothetical protein